MKNFVGLKAEIKKQKAIRARLDVERTHAAARLGS